MAFPSSLGIQISILPIKSRHTGNPRPLKYRTIFCVISNLPIRYKSFRSALTENFSPLGMSLSSISQTAKKASDKPLKHGLSSHSLSDDSFVTRIVAHFHVLFMALLKSSHPAKRSITLLLLRLSTAMLLKTSLLIIDNCL